MSTTVKLGGDSSEFKAAAVTATSSMEGLRGKTIEFAQVLARSNAESQKTKVVLAGLTDAGEKVYVTFTKVGDALKASSVTISNTRKTLKDLQDQLTATAEANKARAASTVGEELRKFSPFEGAGADRAIEYERILLRIRKAIQDGSVSAQRFNEILTQFGSGGAASAAEGLNAKELQLYQNIVRLTRAGTDLEAQKKQAGSEAERLRLIDAQKAITSVTGALSPAQLNTSQLSAYQAALSQIINLFRDGKINIEQFNKILGDIQFDPLNALKLVDESERKLAKSISEVIKLTRQASEEEVKRGQAATAAQRQRQSTSDANAAETELRRTTDTSGFSIRQLNAFEAAIQRIKQALASGEISLKRFQELFATISKNPKALIPTDTISADEAKVVTALRGIASGFNEVKTAGERFGISLQGIARLLEALTIKRLAFGLISEFEQSVTAAKDFSIKISEIQTIAQKSGLTTDQWAAGVSKLSSEFGNTKADIAEAAYQSLSNQISKGKDTFDFLTTALNFSKASVSSAADSVNLLSSAINSFNLPVSQADQISASFFKTIDLGRLRASDLANTYGRVGVAAHTMGIQINEVNAGLAVLTQSGISPSQAITFLSSLIIHLTKPTKELTDLFNELGFANAQAAINAKGFGGVLQILDSEARRNSASTNSLLVSIRDFQAQANLSGEGLSKYKDFLNQISTANNQFTNAVNVTKESVGQQFAVQIEKLRNEFITTFGTPTLNLITKVSQAMGDLDNAFKIFINTIKIVGISYIAVKGTIITGNLIMASSTAALSATWVGLGNSIKGATASAIAFVRANPVLTLVGAAAVVGGAIAGLSGNFDKESASIEELKQRAEEADNQRIEREKARDRESNAQQRDNEQQLVNEAQTAYNKKYDVILDYTTKVIKLSNLARKSAIDNGKDIAEQLKLSTKTYIDSIQERINDLTRDAGKARTLIQESKNHAEDIPKKLSDTLFNQKLGSASEGIEGLFPNQKLILIENRIKEIFGLARSEGAKNTQESIAESRRYYDEVQKLEVERFNLVQGKRRQEFEQRVAKGEEQPIGIDAQGQQRFIFITQTADLEKKINALTRERLAVEQKIQETQAATLRKKLDDAEKEKTRVRELQEEIKKAAEFSSRVFDEQGKVKPEFLKDPKKVTGDFDKIIARIQELAGPEGQKDLKFFSDLYKQKQSIARETEIAIQTEAAKTAQDIITKNKQAANKIAEDAKEAIEKGRTGFQENTSALNKFLDSVGVGTTNKSRGPDLLDRLATIVSPTKNKAVNEDFEKIARSEEARKSAQEALFAANEARKTLVDDKNVVNAQRYADSIELLNNRIRQYIALRTGQQADQQAFTDEAAKGTLTNPAKTIAEYLQQSSNAAQGLVKSLIQQEEGARKLSQVRDQADLLDATIKKIPKGLDDIKDSGQRASDIIRAGFKGIEGDADSLILKLNTIKNNLDQLKLDIPVLKNQAAVPQAPGQMFGGFAKHYDSGGWIGFKPRGSDDRPIVASKDEFVVNSQSARMYGPILEAINRNKNDTGNSSITNNVGDIHMNIQGGANEEITIRRIAQGLRRELKRGTIILG